MRPARRPTWNARPSGALRLWAAVLTLCIGLPAWAGDTDAATAAGAVTPPASARSTLCADAATVRVTAARETEAQDLCRGASAALNFLAAQDLRTDMPIVIVVTERLPDAIGPEAAGCYLHERREILVLGYERFRRSKTWFGVPITRELYRALAAHETAHAVARCQFAPVLPTAQAQEYVAYVSMFATMPAALRTRALRNHPGTGFENADAIKPIILAFDPMRFGAESYRHFVRLPDGAAFLRDVLAGRELTD